jgi:hypothetical protein
LNKLTLFELNFTYKNGCRRAKMAETMAVLDILPDNDSFLPRYQIVQLLAVLATTPLNEPEPQSKLSEQAEKFIAGFKSHELFTPLTYSIFWRENIKEAVVDNKISLDTTDKYNRAPLTLALANEDFVLANELVQKGATLLLEDKLVLEIALTSMIQRDEIVIEKILAATADADINWVADYLDYLQSYVSGIPDIKQMKYHEVLNPPFRHFGQVLDTLSYFNGLPSHYGFLSPSITNLTTHLKNYSKEIVNAATQGLFSTIANAYVFSYQHCKFHGNLPTVPDAAKLLAAQINSNISNKSLNVVVVFGGWAGNSVTIAFINNILVFSNLGTGGNPNAGTKIFTISNPAAITEHFIDSFMRGLGNASSPTFILSQLAEIVDEKPLYTLPQSLNPIDNCIYVNPRAIIQGILLVLSAFTKSNPLTADSLAAVATAVSDMYKDYVDSLYKHSAVSLARFMRNHELLQNKRIECCSLAIDYINQHYKDENALPRCIELKNALEFVGLKSYYINKVEPEAQQAIRNLIIHEQEATAIKVIEQEFNMAAGQQATGT